MLAGGRGMHGGRGGRGRRGGLRSRRDIDGAVAEGNRGVGIGTGREHADAYNGQGSLRGLRGIGGGTGHIRLLNSGDGNGFDVR